MRIAPARPAQLPQILEMLAAAGLPTGGVSDIVSHLLVIEEEGDLVGAGGIEPYGDVALLRSVVVAEAQRGRGTARALCRALEELAAREGARELYLLTETADGYFEKRGYARVARQDAPAAIRASQEFTTLCGASAALMMRSL